MRPRNLRLIFVKMHFLSSISSVAKYSFAKISFKEQIRLRSTKRSLEDIKDTLGRMGTGHISLDLDWAEGIAKIQLQNPKKRNALDGKMMVELASIVDQLEEHVHRLENDLDADIARFHLHPKVASHATDSHPISVVILTGDEKSFCTGFDLSVAKEELTSAEGGAWMNILMTDTLSRFAKLPLITISAIDGYSMGGGSELATATDFRVLNDKATLRFVQTRMGIVPGWGGGQRLIDIVGRRQALYFLASTHVIHADEAKSVGLADQVTIHPALDFATKWARNHFLKGPDGTSHAPQSLRAMKRMSVDGNESQEFQRLWGSRVNVDRVNGFFK